MKRTLTCAVVAALCLFFSTVGFSQGGNSQLGGVVADLSGALLPGVTITLTNTDTSVMNTTITNESGSYNFPSLQPGNRYSVAASLPGIGSWSFDANLSKTFRLTESKNVQIRIDTTNVLNHPVPATTGVGALDLNSHSGTFGQINNKTGGRSFQGTMRFQF